MATRTESPPTALTGGPTDSTAGPAEGAAPHPPPALDQPAYKQSLTFLRDPLEFHLGAARRMGDVWRTKLDIGEHKVVMTSHPEHVRSLFTARPEDAPSLTGASPLRPILGPRSVLTLIGEQHMRQRKLLLPPFHGDAVRRYVEMIAAIAEREIGSWPVGEPFALAPRMQALTLEVIMGGIFGIEGQPERGSSEYKLREVVRRMTRISTHPLWLLVEVRNAGREEARGVLRLVNALIDRPLYATIAKRRAEPAREHRRDILSLLLEATDEAGEPLTDEELRDELITLVLAGHETTANQLAWTFERLLRTPRAYDELRDAVRSDTDDSSSRHVEATIQEGMRVRPVVPLVARRVTRPWRLGDYVVPAETPVAVSIVALHHRADVYPEPHAFRPQRFLDSKPGTYTWVPFGGGIRRCLGAELAMAEQRVVLAAIARRTDLSAPDPAPEIGRQRNVTMIPNHGCRVVVGAKHA